MGGTFTGATIVTTGNQKNPLKLGNDSIVPDLGALPATGAAMTGDTGLPPTNGVDVKLIHGNRWQEIQGTLTENAKDTTTTITGSETHHVTVSQTLTIDVNQTITVSGNLSVTIHGVSGYTYFGAQDNTNISTLTTNVAALQADSGPQHFTALTWQGQAFIEAFQFIGTQQQLIGMNIQIFLGTFQAAIHNFNLSFTNFNAGGLDVTPKAFATKIEALGSDIKALVMRVGAFFADTCATVLANVIAGVNQIL